MSIGRWSVTFVLSLLGASIGFAEGPLHPPNLPGDYLAADLEDQGVGTDTDSLIEAILGHPDLSVRWRATRLVGLQRREEAHQALERALVNDPERMVREEAALALVRLGDRRYLDEVKEFMVTETSRSHQIILAGQLAELGDFSGYPFVVEAATAKDEHLRSDSAASLRGFFMAGFQGGKESPPEEFLKTLLVDPSDMVQREAILQVAIALNQGARIERFMDTISQLAREDSDPGVRESAQRALASWRAQLREKN